MFKKLIKNSAITLAVSTGLLYIIGIASHNGYISEFGMPTKLFPLNFYQAIKTGFINVIGIILQHLHYIVYVLFGCVIVIGILFALKNTSLKRKRISQEKRLRIPMRKEEKHQIYGTLQLIFLIDYRN